MYLSCHDSKQREYKLSISIFLLSDPPPLSPFKKEYEVTSGKNFQTSFGKHTEHLMVQC